MTSPTQTQLIPPETGRNKITLPKNIGRTAISAIAPKSLLTKGSGFIAAYDGVINPYKGCSFGCNYCYASQFTDSNEQQDNWGNWVQVKTNLVTQINAVKPGSMNHKTYYISTVTDPYQPVEKLAKATRSLLLVILKNHPQARLVIQTRSTLVTRDIDLFGRIEQAGGRVQVNMTVTTDDDEIRRFYEPGCPSIDARLKAVKTLNEGGVQTCITLTPLLPLRNAAAFAATLLATGAERFIVQDFHMVKTDTSKFVAKTPPQAVQTTAQFYDQPTNQAVERYKREYRANLATLQQELPQLGIGKSGFKPPF